MIDNWQLLFAIAHEIAVAKLAQSVKINI